MCCSYIYILKKPILYSNIVLVIFTSRRLSCYIVHQYGIYNRMNLKCVLCVWELSFILMIFKIVVINCISTSKCDEKVKLKKLNFQWINQNWFEMFWFKLHDCMEWILLGKQNWRIERHHHDDDGLSMMMKQWRNKYKIKRRQTIIKCPSLRIVQFHL